MASDDRDKQPVDRGKLTAGGNLTPEARALGYTDSDLVGGQITDDAHGRVERQQDFKQAQKKASDRSANIPSETDVDLTQRTEDAGLQVLDDPEAMAENLATKELIHEGVAEGDDTKVDQASANAEAAVDEADKAKAKAERAASRSTSSRSSSKKK